MADEKTITLDNLKAYKTKEDALYATKTELSAKANASEVATLSTKVDDLASNKQDKLTAGENITISNNTISATGSSVDTSKFVTMNTDQTITSTKTFGYGSGIRVSNIGYSFGSSSSSGNRGIFFESSNSNSNLISGTKRVGIGFAEGFSQSPVSSAGACLCMGSYSTTYTSFALGYSTSYCFFVNNNVIGIHSGYITRNGEYYNTYFIFNGSSITLQGRGEDSDDQELFFSEDVAFKSDIPSTTETLTFTLSDGTTKTVTVYTKE